MIDLNVSKASYDGPVSIWCNSMFLDLAYFRRQLVSGVTDETLECALAAVRLSRYYPKSSGNEANYETFCENLEELSQEFFRLGTFSERAREFLGSHHLPNASAEALVDFCLAEQEKEDLLARRIYENAPFQLLRSDELSEEYEKKIYQRAISTETCLGWFSLTEKLNRLFTDEEVLTALGGVVAPVIRKGLLRSLVSRGLVSEVLVIARSADREEQKIIFWALGASIGNDGGGLGEDEVQFWLAMLEKEPLHFFTGGAQRVVREPSEFEFLLSPLRQYFFARVSECSEEFLLGEECALPLSLLRMFDALEEGFDEELWVAAARYRGYRMIEIDYQNGFKCGERTAQNFPVSEFALSRLIGQGVKPPSDVPVSVPEPYRDPRDR